MSKHELWLRKCEENERKTCLLERYVDDKNVVSIYEVIERYDFNHHFYIRESYCVWDNDKMSVFSGHALALFAYASITNKYIEKMLIKGKGSYTERKVIK